MKSDNDLISVSLVHLPTICDYRQTRSPLEKGAAKGRDRRKRQLSNFFVADMGDCSKYRILQMAVIRDDDFLTWAFIPPVGLYLALLSC